MLPLPYKWLTVLLVGLSVACASANTLGKIEHMVILYGENRGFDNLYGLFPGANGVQNLKPEQYLQTDHDGKAFTTLPPVWSTNKNTPNGVDPQLGSGQKAQAKTSQRAAFPARQRLRWSAAWHQPLVLLSNRLSL